MDFSVDEDAVAIAGAVAEFFDRRNDARGIALAASTGSALDRNRWTALCELGMPALMVEEPQGLGMCLLAASLAAEKVGEVLAPEPVSATTALARTWAEHRGAGALLESLSDGSTMIWFDPHADAEVSEDGVVSGSVVAIADGSIDHVAVLARTGQLGRRRLAVLSTQHLGESVEFEDTDPLRPMARYLLKDVASAYALDLSAADAEKLVTELCVLTSSELVGGMQAVMTQTIGYVREREQFGRSIGSFQTVKHRLADMYVATEQARAAARLAALRIDTGGSAGSVDSAIALHWISRSAIEVCDSAIHLHGAMGYAWEVDVHLFLRRALRTRQLWTAWIAERESIAA